MEMQRFFLFIILIGCSLLGFSQFTTDPAFPVAGQPLKIIFDSKQESRLGSFAQDLYAHTGVGIEGAGNWQHVIGNWGENNKQPKLTYKGDGIYELMITPSINAFYGVGGSEKVVNVSFVFRSSTGNKQTNDLFVTVYQNGLNLDLLFPTDNAILELGKSYSFSAVSSTNATLKLFLDQELLKETTGTTIEIPVLFETAGDHKVLVTAENTEGMKVVGSTYICVMSESLSELMPAGTRKGITYLDDHSVRLSLFAPAKKYVFVLGDFNDWKPMNSYQMKKDGDYFWLDITGLQKGKEYVFQYFIDSELRIADPYSEKISDPWNDSYISSSTYPGLIAYPKSKTEQIATVIQTGQDPYSWEVEGFEIPANKEMVIYELLIRDFTDEHTVQSVVDQLDYLSDLRINVLELMPVNEFEGNSSWGYNPSFYFAPDKYYGPKDGLKRLVDECHNRGIAVVIDMVLNHSYGQSPLVRMYWDAANNRPAANNPWYNTESPNQTYSWGYDFNHESSYTRELVDSVNSYWMSEYHIDGFRFDFTKGFTNTPGDGWAYDAPRIAILKRMADEIWKRKPGALVICEHLAADNEEKELSDHGLMLWGNINNNYCEAAMGYVQGSNSDLSRGVYKHRGWSKPNLVTYQESHDEERVGCKCKTWGNASGGYDTKQLPTALDRMELNAMFHIPLPGPKMIWQFGELGYDFSINTCDDGVTVSENCRLAEKPLRWDYLGNPDRVGLFGVIASLNYLKQNYEEFSMPTNFSYSLSGAQKSYKLTFGTYHVVGIGNFALEPVTMSVSFPVTGTWHDYFGKKTFEVTGETMTIALQPGEYRLLSTREFLHPTIKRVGKEQLKTGNVFRLYPNPAENKLWIAPSRPGSVAIYNLYGKRVAGVNVSDTGEPFVVDIGMLQRGIYLVKATGKNGFIETGRFVKE